MTVYVDPLMSNGWKLRGHSVRNCHLFTDGPIEDLHALAQRIGMQRRWFQDHRIPHYDLTESRRIAAIAAGAVEMNRRQAVEIWARIQACGQSAHVTVKEKNREPTDDDCSPYDLSDHRHPANRMLRG